MQAGRMWLSGMAEHAPSLDGQLDKSLAEIDSALAREASGWNHVREANLFLERGAGELGWLEARFKQAVPNLPPQISYTLVDGLASPEKKLEIEAIASLGK